MAGQGNALRALTVVCTRMAREATDPHDVAHEMDQVVTAVVSWRLLADDVVVPR